MATPGTRIALVGAAFTGNQGAAAMLEAVITRIPERVPGCTFAVLSHYPDTDREHASRWPSVEVARLEPSALVVAFLLALPAGILRVVRLPWRWLCCTSALRALRRTTLVVDVTGISFSDSRGVPRHVYHFLLAAVPLLLGIPIVKASQAMGPFHTLVNRTLARVVLPRIDTICARGPITAEELATIPRVHVERAADLAFLLQGRVGADRRIAEVLDRAAIGDAWMAVLPSEVVHRRCLDEGIDYPGLVAKVIDRYVTEYDRGVVIAPHSALDPDRTSMMNDRPVCRDIAGRVRELDRVLLLDETFAAVELRELIGRSETTLTSRFHAAISALETATPLVVTAWSHKYREVLDEFGLSDAAIDYHGLTAASLWERVAAMHDGRAAIEARIAEHLPAVVASSENNLDVIERALGARA